MVQAGGIEILSLTPSKVHDYLACPQQYKLKNKTPRWAETSSQALSFGQSIHAALEDVHARLLPSDGEVDCGGVLRRHWRAEDYSDGRESEQYFARGCEALSRYVRVLGRNVDRVVGTELYLSRVVRLEDNRIRLGCKVDRLDLHPDGALEALDYKTNASGQVPTAQFLEDDLASFVYYVLVRLTYPESNRVIVSQLNVLTLAKVEVEYGSVKITAHKQALSELVRAIKAGDFDPRPSSACSWCKVKDLCPAFGPDADLDGLV